MSEFDKRIGYISNVNIKNGSVICEVEDKDIPDQTYSPVIYANSSFSTMSAPPLKAKVVVEEVSGQKIITGVISSPGFSSGDEAKMEEGAESGSPSMSFIFGESNSIDIEYTDEGYDVTISVEGDVTIDSSTVKLGGESGTKVVARKGDTVETTDPLTGTNTGEITSGASNTEAK